MGSHIILRLNTVTKTWYDADGALFSDEMPQIPYKSSAKVEIHLYKETPQAGSEGVNIDTDWVKDTQYAVTGITARLSADNNFLRHTKGTLATAVSSGSVASVTLTLPGINSVGELDEEGTIRLFSADGTSESLSYEARSKASANTYTFTIASGSSLENSYAQGADADSTESLYMTAAMSVDDSDPANGVFSFDITAYSQKLREAADYANSIRVDDVQGLELAIGKVENSTTTLLNSYICRTFSIPLPMAEINSTPAVPDAEEDNIAAITTSLLASGFSVQFSTDGTTWHDAPQQTSDVYYRFRLASTPSAPWAVVLMTRGDDGDAATVEVNPIVTHGTDVTPTVVNSGTSNAAILNFTVKDGQNAYVYVGYASDDQGTDFSLTQSSGLKYRAEIQTSSAIETPVASNFTGKWAKYIGDDGTDSFMYVGYASDSAGTDFSLTPTNSLKYRAEIHTSSAIATPVYTDFADATWVKYIGDNGAAGSGTGDMLISVYDTDSNGKVDSAEAADMAAKLTSARYIGSAAFDGTANITLAQIGVNNATVTFLQGGTSKGSITLNQSGNTSISFDAGGGGGSVAWGGISGTLSSQTDLSSALSAKQDEITSSSKLDYSLLSNTPSIPTVNDSTITIKQGGVTKGTFTLNQNSSATINLDAGGGGGGGADTETVRHISLIYG